MKTKELLLALCFFLLTLQIGIAQTPIINKPTEPDDDIPATGCVQGDCENGFGNYQYDNGSYYGFFKDGKKSDFGIYMWSGVGSYVGSWKNNTMSGYGEFLDENDDNQSGIYSDGLLNGIGYSVIADVWEQGIYQDGLLKTAYPFEKNNEDVGCTYGDCKNSFGYFLYEDGGNFTGFFENGSFKMGIFVFESGDKYYGTFNKDNQLDGAGRYFFTEAGTSYSGQWKNGEMSGKGYFTGVNEEDDLIGEFKNGQLVNDMNPYK